MMVKLAIRGGKIFKNGNGEKDLKEEEWDKNPQLCKSDASKMSRSP